MALIHNNFVHSTITSFRPPSFVANQVPSTAPVVRSKVPRCCAQTIVRRTANYHPSIWSYEDIQSLTSLDVGESHTSRAEELIADVRMMLQIVVEPLEQLQLIDTLQILGISYHFEEDIDAILKDLFVKGDYNNGNQKQIIGPKSLYHTALEFRLLRQQGLHVPPDVFESFKDEKGSFDERHWKDTEELLCLYQATFLSVENEAILEDAKEFARKHLLEKLINQEHDDHYLAKQVEHALKLPLHRRMRRLEARWSIDIYENRKKCNPLIIELAKLDFNMVQAKYQEELKYVSRWWRETGLAERMTFARDRTMESFFWAVGIKFEPRFGEFRIMLARLALLVNIIDDVYDVYGTLDELDKFTDVVKGWEINDMDQLPDYLKICFVALFNSINDMGYEVLKKHGINVVGCLQKEWAEVCKAYHLEAKWHHSGFVPTFQEYLDNAKITVACSLVLRLCYFFTTNPLSEEAMERLDYFCTNTISIAAVPFRLSDDLATESEEKERGDAPKAMQCYTHETGASEDEAREFIDRLINQAWEKLNGEKCSDSGLPKAFKESAMNLVRSAQCVYEYGDGHGHGCQDGHTPERIVSLLVEPIPMARIKREQKRMAIQIMK